MGFDRPGQWMRTMTLPQAPQPHNARLGRAATHPPAGGGLLRIDWQRWPRAWWPPPCRGAAAWVGGGVGGRHVGRSPHLPPFASGHGRRLCPAAAPPAFRPHVHGRALPICDQAVAAQAPRRSRDGRVVQTRRRGQTAIQDSRPGVPLALPPPPTPPPPLFFDTPPINSQPHNFSDRGEGGALTDGWQPPTRHPTAPP